MAYLRLIREIAAAFKAKDYKLALQKLAELLTLIAGTPVLINPQFPDGMRAESADAVLAEIDAFVAANEQGDGLQADGELLRKIVALIVKILPYILAGL